MRLRVLAKGAEDSLPQGPEAVNMGQHCVTQLSCHRLASCLLPGLWLPTALMLRLTGAWPGVGGACVGWNALGLFFKLQERALLLTSFAQRSKLLVPIVSLGKRSCGKKQLRGWPLGAGRHVSRGFGGVLHHSSAAALLTSSQGAAEGGDGCHTGTCIWVAAPHLGHV